MYMCARNTYIQQEQHTEKKLMCPPARMFICMCMLVTLGTLTLHKVHIYNEKSFRQSKEKKNGQSVQQIFLSRFITAQSKKKGAAAIRICYTSIPRVRKTKDVKEQKKSFGYI